MDRREFLMSAGAAGGGLAGRPHDLSRVLHKEFVGVLVDTTRCIGCRSCEVACAESHGMAPPDVKNDGALAAERKTSEDRFTVVNRYETDAGTVYVKKQCMHCWQPACSSACLTNAMEKTEDGPVIWNEDKCMGCRYCMVACPFEIPKYEYDSWNPRVRKCDMCWDRLERGEVPACVKACPVDALMFGMKRDLMEIAQVRIYNHPERYHHAIYGQHEVGGTGWLYLSAAPFEQLGFRTDLGTTPYPEYTREFLYGVPVMFLLGPAMLLGLHQLSKRGKQIAGEGEE
jgi:Fe-S-cluster-containing dehydrogenase component